MGLFGKIFSKQTCEICGKESGPLSRVKLKDGTYICSDCRKNASGFYNPSKYTLDEVKKHFKYMEKMDELYEKEFATIEKGRRDRNVHLGFYGIEFADDIGMFEIISSEAKKSKHKELFRYDQIDGFETYGIPNSGEGKKKYKETGVRLKMRCAEDVETAGSSAEEKARMHPYVSEIKIPIERDVDTITHNGLILGHLNFIFGGKSNTIFGAVKEKFVGTGRDKAGRTAQFEAMGALGSLLKGDIDEATKKAGAAMDAAMDFLTENRHKYGKLADEAEKRALGKTLREINK
ncbi:DUF4428 domain-containing protein [Candidatus Saccharibacteria bacterium]|nr:DUF4428 domain-containing protein [Candidatus Saccharibacteria bacterium]